MSENPETMSVASTSTDGPIPKITIDNLSCDQLETDADPLATTRDHKEDHLVTCDGEILFVPKELPSLNVRALPKESKTYMLETFKSNLMLMFNHEFVDGYHRRVGTDKDEESLRKTFKRFGFKVLSYKDKLREEVGHLLVKFSKFDFTNYGCIVIVVLTHGSELGALRAKDKKYRQKQIIEKLKVNPTLATKPIIIILQACRGERRQEVNVIIAQKDNAQNQKVGHYSLPTDADTLVLNSTYEGKYSYRDENSGSWFIQSLCSKINELAETTDFESIMTEVKYTVAVHRENRILDLKTNKMQYNKQMPDSHSTFIRKLYLIRSEVLESVEEVAIDYGATASVVSRDYFADPTLPCQDCLKYGLERYRYMVNCLDDYINNNDGDAKAKSLWKIAKSQALARSESVEDAEAKIEMSKWIRNFFREKQLDHYKFVYIWEDVDE